MWTSTTKRWRCMWVRCSPRTSVDCCCATRCARCGWSGMVSRSARVARPAPSVAGCAGRWNTGIVAAGYRGAGRPAACMPTTSFIGRTVASPSCTIWSWCARITTGCTIKVASPLPDLLMGWSSPTPRADSSAVDHSRDHPPQRVLRCRRAPGQPGNGPNGGGTNPSNHHPHRRPTKGAAATATAARPVRGTTAASRSGGESEPHPTS